MLTPKGGNSEGYNASAHASPTSEENVSVHTTIPPQEERVSIEDVPF